LALKAFVVEDNLSIRDSLIEALSELTGIATCGVAGNEKAAVAWLTDLLKLPPHAMMETRRVARADIAAMFADPAALSVDDILAVWNSPEAQSVLHALVARLKSKG